MIPSIPPGSTHASLINALQFLQCSTNPTFYRCVVHCSMSPSYALFGDPRTPVEIALQHSTLPVALQTLSEVDRQEFLRSLSFTTTSSESLKRIKSMLQFEASSSKRCPKCVFEDLENYGLAFARYVHQIRTVKTCSEHDVMLETSCADCGAGFELPSTLRKGRHALEFCRRCGSKKGASVNPDNSEGYKAYVELIARGGLGNAPEVHPTQLTLALDRFSELTIEHGIDLRPVLMKFWRVGTWEEVCERIGASSGELGKSLIFGRPPHTVLGTYGLASFYHSCISTDKSLPIGRSTNLQAWTFMNPYKVDQEVRERAHQLGLPMKIVLYLIKGNWAAVRRTGALKLVRDFFMELDERQQTRIRNARRRALNLAWFNRRIRRGRLSMDV